MKNLQLTELQPLIIEWAKNKNLLFPENAPKQRLKLIEECGELAQAILKNDVKLQKDAIGDIFVVLVILAEQTNENINYYITDDECYNDYVDYAVISSIITDKFYYKFHSLRDISYKLKLDLVECANIAWNEIKNRTGQAVNGTFIKD
jgi:hypothetical protein